MLVTLSLSCIKQICEFEDFLFFLVFLNVLGNSQMFTVSDDLMNLEQLKVCLNFKYKLCLLIYSL